MTVGIVATDRDDGEPRLNPLQMSRMVCGRLTTPDRANRPLTAGAEGASRRAPTGAPHRGAPARACKEPNADGGANAAATAVSGARSSRGLRLPPTPYLWQAIPCDKRPLHASK